MKNSTRNNTLLILTFSFFLGSCSPVAVTGTPSMISSSTPSIGATATPGSMACTLLHVPVTPEAALGAAFEGHGHISGPAQAPVTIIAFSDYQCLPCAFLAASLKQVRETHNDVRIIYLNAPQANRDKDNLAIQAVEAADLQGKFWEMHDLLFGKQSEWTSLTPAAFIPWVEKEAVSLGLDVEKFSSDFNSTEVAARLQKAIQFTAGIQSSTTPLLFVNSTSPYTSLADFASLDTVIRMDALTVRQYSACPPESVNPLKQYLVTLHTVRGDVVLQLFPEKAPEAVNNFVFLARNGWYDGITFYRVLPGDRVSTGDPSDTGMGNPGYLFQTEIPANLGFGKPGMVAMDNDGPGTNGSRFFITLAPAPLMNGLYTIFGQVLSGLDILSTLTLRDPHPGSVLPPGDELLSVTVEER